MGTKTREVGAVGVAYARYCLLQSLMDVCTYRRETSLHHCNYTTASLPGVVHETDDEPVLTPTLLMYALSSSHARRCRQGKIPEAEDSPA